MPRFLQALRSLATGRLVVVPVIDDAPPSSAYSAAVALLQDLASSLQAYVNDRAKRCVFHYLGDKSQSERIFLASVLLTVVLFVVIVPAYEALLGGSDNEKEDGALLSATPSPRVSMRMVNVGGMTEPPLSRASSSGSSCGSCSMETIEESEEENLEDDDDHKHRVGSIFTTEEPSTKGEGADDKVKYMCVTNLSVPRVIPYSNAAIKPVAITPRLLHVK
jgi:hypothetical protein